MLFQFNEEVLRRPSEPVSKKEGLRISRLLFKELDKHVLGAGLAAPQIGIHARVFVLSCKGYRAAFVNPVLLEAGRSWIHGPERCLSFPGEEWTTWRHGWVRIGTDNMGETELGGYRTHPDRYDDCLLAKCVQHELGHLDGLLPWDHTEQYGYQKVKEKSRRLTMHQHELGHRGIWPDLPPLSLPVGLPTLTPFRA